MQLDSTTIASLELVFNAVTQKSKKGSLFACINLCKTPLGGNVNCFIVFIKARVITGLVLLTARLLRANLLQPLNDVLTIETRHAAVEDLLSHEDAFFDISSLLPSFCDLGQVINCIGMVSNSVFLTCTLTPYYVTAMVPKVITTRTIRQLIISIVRSKPPAMLLRTSPTIYICSCA